MITILRFFADWCGPCKALEPTWNKIKEAYEGKFLFQDIDIDSNPQTREDHFIRAIPTLIMVEDGKEIARRNTGGTYQELEAWLNEQGPVQRELF